MSSSAQQQRLQQADGSGNGDPQSQAYQSQKILFHPNLAWQGRGSWRQGFNSTLPAVSALKAALHPQGAARMGSVGNELPWQSSVGKHL